MHSGTQVRQLAGIVFTDIVGFTEMMGEDENRTRAILARQREILFPVIQRCQGKVLKEMGDGFLIVFGSVINAVRCSVEIQNAEKNFQLRIGIHIGDVIIENDDVFGSGVNIASRVEGLASPGSICITADVWRQIDNQTDLHVRSLGIKRLKGVREPIEIYEITRDALEKKPSLESATPKKASSTPLNIGLFSHLFPKRIGKRLKPTLLLLPLLIPLALSFFEFEPTETAAPFSQGAIAVLPIENLSPNRDDAYFADGVHQDIIIHLSQIGDMEVIARSSVLSFEPGERDLLSIADELNVASVLEGNIRRAGDVIRISVQLTDPRSNRTLWAEIYDREITDIFAIQSDIAREIADALEVRITAAEERAVDRLKTEDLEAYRLYVLGRGLWDQRTDDGMRRSVNYFQQAIEQDSDYALAWAGLADALSTIKFYNLSPQTDLTAEEAALKALSLDPELGEARASLGIAYAVNLRGPEAVQELERAVELSPSYAEAQLWLGWLYLVLGEPTGALPPLEQSVRLNPLAPASRLYLAEAYLANGRTSEALREAQHARSLQPGYGLAHYMEALVLYHLGDYAEAKSALQKAMPLVRSGGMPDRANVLALNALTDISIGDITAARDRLPEIRATGDSFSEGLVLLGLGDVELAFDAFERVSEWDNIPAIHFQYLFPDILGRFHSDPRYQQLSEKLRQSWGQSSQ